MTSDSRTGRADGRIVWRFALTSLLVFALVAAGTTWFRTRDVRTREERAAVSRAELVSVGAIEPILGGRDLSVALPSDVYGEVQETVRQLEVADPGVKRVKIWGPDGTVRFSDDPTQVGVRPPAEDDLSEALEGNTESDVSDLTAPENTSEKTLADKLFETYVPIRDANGDIYGVVEVYRDYGVIQAEIDRLTRTLSISFGIGLLALWMLLLPVMVGVTRRLRRQNEQLSEQADQLESHLEREQATVAELRELDRLKGDFVAAASHELRTPLTSIRGYANLLRNPDTAHETTLEAVDAIERQTSRMLRLVTNLLRESRIERDGVITGPVLFDLASLVEEVVADFHSDGRRFSTALSPDLPAVHCDRGKVGDVLTNLADNALKYSPAGSPIEIGASLGDEGLVLWVADHGPGIDPADAPRIFDRFYQADQSATRRHGGVGLGLHIVHGLVDSLGGWIRVDQTPGGGATFTFMVPLVAQESDASALPHEGAPTYTPSR